ncbi:MAG: glycerol-3-phosphate acyltransferase [Chloroflexi bacterium]|nr:glycerol-3-phosphate acyltransferase [Chloroflexota bacterium]
MPFEFWSLVAGSYLLGSVPSAYLAGKWSRGIDIRQYGSGNVGATNLLHFTSKRVAIPVIIFDVLKGMIVVLVAWRLGFGLAGQVVVGLAAISGHNWPCFLRFNGGRGIITTLGVAFMVPLINNLVPLEMVILITIVLNAIVWVSSFCFKGGPLGVFIVAASMPLLGLGFDAPLPYTLGLLGMFLMLVLRRLTAPQPISITSMSKRQALLNRLLFDRDIREKEAWMSLVLEQQEKQGKVSG